MKRVVLFQVGNQSYGLDLFYSRGIENYGNIMVIPNAPDNVQGVVKIRNEIIPVYSLRRKFHLPETKVTDDTKLIVGKIQGMTIAYLVDKVMEILEVSDEDMTPAPAIVRSDETNYMEAIIQSKAGLSILINQDGMLAKAEKEQLERIVSEMEKKREEQEERKKAEERLRKEEERRKREEERLRKEEEQKEKP